MERVTYFGPRHNTLYSGLHFLHVLFSDSMLLACFSDSLPMADLRNSRKFNSAEFSIYSSILEPWLRHVDKICTLFNIVEVWLKWTYRRRCCQNNFFNLSKITGRPWTRRFTERGTMSSCSKVEGYQNLWAGPFESRLTWCWFGMLTLELVISI